MKPLPRGLILAVVTAALISGAWLSLLDPAGTLAAFTDAEAGAMRFTGDVPIATCAVFWADDRAAKDTLKITGSDHTFRGCLHSNNDFALGGSRNIFERTVRYNSTFGNNFNGHQLKAGAIQVTKEPYPFPFDIARYAPGGCRALQAQARGEYWTHTGNVQIKGGPLKTGLHYIVGSATVDLTGFTGNATFVATSGIKVTADGNGLAITSTDVGAILAQPGPRPYVDHLIAFANGVGPNQLTFGSNGGNVVGAFYAPNGALSFAGQTLSYTGQVMGNTVTVSGSGSVFRPLAPVGNNVC